MLVIADTSALVALAAADSLSLLDQLFGTLRVPRSVQAECIVPGKPGAERLQSFLKGKDVQVQREDLVVAGLGLGLGELDAMTLYRRLQADFLLVDDHRARKVAQVNGISIVGSLGIILRAKEAGLVVAVRPLLDRIRAAGLFYSSALTEEVLRLAGE